MSASPIAEWEITLLAGEATYAYLAEEIPRAARAAHRRFPLIEAEDFEQEMWSAVLGDAERYRGFHQDGAADKVWAELKRVATAYGMEDDRDRRARKAAAAGYRTADEEFYTHRMLATAIEILIEAEWEPANAVERATQVTDNAGVKVHSGNNENATELLEVTLIDVAGAFKRLKPHFQLALTDYYGLDQSDTADGRWQRQQKASSLGLTLDALKKRAYYALDKLQQELGGKSPYIKRVRRKTV